MDVGGGSSGGGEVCSSPGLLRANLARARFDAKNPRRFRLELLDGKQGRGLKFKELWRGKRMSW